MKTQQVVTYCEWRGHPKPLHLDPGLDLEAVLRDAERDGYINIGGERRAIAGIHRTRSDVQIELADRR